MHSTHDVYCKKCGKNLAFWSGFGDNMQYYDEYQCTGKAWKKIEHYHFGKTTQYNDEPPTPEYIIECYGKLLKVLHHMKELWDCWMVNETYFCKECAKKLKYKCPICGGKIKLSRKS